MEEIKIIEVPMSEEQKKIDDIMLNLYGNTNRYYIGYANKEMVSILFIDLTWIRKHYSNDKGLITFDSLNKTRKAEISNYKKALKRNCPLWEMGKFNDDDTIKTFTDMKGNVREYKPQKLTETDRKHFQKNIDKGYYYLYKLVR